MNEESDNREHTTIYRNHDMTDRSRHANIFAVLDDDDDDEKLKINTKKGRNLGNRALIPVPPPPLTPCKVLTEILNKRIFIFSS